PDVPQFRFRTVVPDNRDGLLDLGQSTLPQDIELEYPHVLRNDHIELYRREPLRWQGGRRKAMCRSLQYQNTRGMHTDVVGHSVDIGGVLQDQFGELVQGSMIEPPNTQLIDLLLGQAEDLAQLP